MTTTIVKKVKKANVGQPDAYMSVMDGDNSNNLSLDTLKTNTVTSPTDNLTLDAATGKKIIVNKPIDSGSNAITTTGTITGGTVIGAVYA